jgi:hypothetical protein
MAPTAERTSNQSAIFGLPHVQPANITRRCRCIKPVDGSDREAISLWQHQRNPVAANSTAHYCTSPMPVASARSARAATIALSRASGPNANFSARMKVILVMPIKPNRVRR